jgi:hypothetical protein
MLVNPALQPHMKVPQVNRSEKGSHYPCCVPCQVQIPCFHPCAILLANGDWPLLFTFSPGHCSGTDWQAGFQTSEPVMEWGWW